VRGAQVAGVVLGVGAIAGAAFVILRSKRASAATASPRERSWDRLPQAPAPPVLSHSAREWIPLFKELGPDVPLAAALAWTDQESGGNVCSIGNKPPSGAKYPAEYGLSQLDVSNPENAAIMSQASARAACQNSGATRAAWEVQLRPLTDAERGMHAKAALDHMRSAHAHAQARIAGWGWNPNGIDAWNMSKLYHAGPAYVNLAASVARELGHAPRDFAEFQTRANAIGLRSGFTQGHLDQAWNNVAHFAKRMVAFA
jgi:hypothetical protein